MRKKILIISFSELDRDPRVYRQILALQDEYQLITAGLANPGIEGIQFCPIDISYRNDIKKFAWERIVKTFFMQLKNYEKAYWTSKYVCDAWEKLKLVDFDLVLANDVISLPLAAKLAEKNKAKIFLDAHEYHAKGRDDKKKFYRIFMQSYWDWILKTFLPRVNAMTTVAPNLAKAFEEEYNVKCDIIYNTPHYKKLEPRPITPDKIRIIHHGGVNPDRRVENMVYLMDLLDNRFYLDFILINNNTRVLHKIKHLSKGNPRIRFRDPVPMPMVSEAINEYDIGIFLLWPESFSYKYALPNKFFEFIQGRLAISIWPSPEMATIVREYELGVVSDDFSLESAANQLNSLTPEAIWSYKMNSHKAASVFCAEQSREKLLGMVKGILKG